jgi:hypothetical protein
MPRPRRAQARALETAQSRGGVERRLLRIPVCIVEVDVQKISAAVAIDIEDVLPRPIKCRNQRRDVIGVNIGLSRLLRRQSEAKALVIIGWQLRREHLAGDIIEEAVRHDSAVSVRCDRQIMVTCWSCGCSVSLSL